MDGTSNPKSTLQSKDVEEHEDRAKGVGSFLVSIGMMFAALFAVDNAFRYSKLSQQIDMKDNFGAKAVDFPKYDPDIMITGDSRIHHGISPDAISAVVEAETGKKVVTYNAGLPYAHACTMMLFANRIVENKRHKPKVVILSPSAVMFSSPTDGPADVYFANVIRPQDIPAMVRAASTPEEAAEDVSMGAFKLLASRTLELAILEGPQGVPGQADMGHLGWLSLGGRTDPGTQDARARGRAGGYRPALLVRNGRASEIADRYLRVAVEVLQHAGIKVGLMGSPQARQLDANHGAGSIWPDYVSRVNAIARDYSVPFVNMNDTPVIENIDFEDGDHLSEPGAQKLGAYLAHNLIVPLVGPQKIDERTDCRVVFDFDEPPLTGWTVTGNAFGNTTSPGTVGDPTVFAAGYLGPRFLSSRPAKRPDEATGSAISPAFTIDAPKLRFRMNGGAREGLEAVLQIDNVDRIVAQAPGSDTMSVVEWDVSAMRGASAHLAVRDRSPAGHVGIDDVRLCP